MASHHRRKALQHLRITSGRTVLRRAVAAAVSVSGSWGQVGRSSDGRSSSEHPTPMAHQSVAWRLQQQQLQQQPLPVVHLLLVSRRPQVQLQLKAANPQFHRMLQRAVATAVSSAKLVKRQYTGSTAAAAAAAAGAAVRSISSSWWRSFIRGAAAAGRLQASCPSRLNSW